MELVWIFGFGFFLFSPFFLDFDLVLSPGLGDALAINSVPIDKSFQNLWGIIFIQRRFSVLLENN